MGDEILYEVDNAVAWLTINRPEARNAMSAAVREGLAAGLSRFSESNDARVLVITGAGDQAFCAGADLKEMAGTRLKVPPAEYLPQVGRGAPWAAPLPWLIPPRVAMQLLLTGDPISAQRAHEIGLVNEVVPAAS